MYQALRSASVRSELHVFDSGGHGFGLRGVAGRNVACGRNWCRAGRLPMTHRKPEIVNSRRRFLCGAATLAAASAAPLARVTAAQAAGGAPSPTLRTRAGRVRGFLDGDLMVFVASAMARIRVLAASCRRWRRKAGKASPRRAFGAASAQPGNEANQSEDCLFLNVVAPASEVSESAAGHRLHPRWRVFIGVGRQSAVRRRDARAGAATWWWSRSIIASACSAISGCRAFRTRATPASSISCWRSSGCATTSRPSAATRAASPC